MICSQYVTPKENIPALAGGPPLTYIHQSSTRREDPDSMTPFQTPKFRAHLALLSTHFLCRSLSVVTLHLTTAASSCHLPFALWMAWASVGQCKDDASHLRNVTFSRSLKILVIFIFYFFYTVVILSSITRETRENNLKCLLDLI